MLTIKYLLLGVAAVMFAAAAARIIYDLSRKAKREDFAVEEEAPDDPFPIGWRMAGLLAAAAWVPLLAGLSIVVVPSGMAGVRVSQISGTRPGTLYPGTHWIVPLIESVAVYDVRDHLFVTSAAEPVMDEKTKSKPQVETLHVQTKEGLLVGVAVAVRYRLDPKRLHFIHDNLPQPAGLQLVPPVVASVFRQEAPNYMVRELFATKREEIRQRSAETITTKLAADAILVKEVMLRNILLPDSYAEGLEGLLLEEQRNERLAVEIEVKRKLVQAAELEAEAEKARQIKHAEGQASVRVIKAKSEADAMEHTLPLKQKQIEQSRLEAEARKEARIADAEAAAEAKVIDGEAERELRKMMAEAQAHEIRLKSAADADRMELEAQVLAKNPMLIQKIVAERLSDKVQIMMVPTDGKYFFANDVLRSLPMAAMAQPNTN